MIALGIESATESLGAALDAGAESRASVRITGRRRHAESLAPAIEAVLERTGTALRALEAIAVDVGPGLFTGLRVGVAMAKGLAQGLGIGLIGLNSLEVLATAAFDAGWDGTVLSVVDGRRGEVFAAHFGLGSSATDLEELVGPVRVRPEDLLGALLCATGKPVLACGDGAAAHRERLAGNDRVSVAGSTLAAPDPAALLRLALARLERGDALVGPNELEVCYLREPDTKINWVQRLAPESRDG